MQHFTMPTSLISSLQIYLVSKKKQSGQWVPRFAFHYAIQCDILEQCWLANGDKVSISYKESKGESSVVSMRSAEVRIPNNTKEDNSACKESSGAEAAAAPVDDAASNAEKAEHLSNFKVGIDDNAGRHKSLISTAIITDVLTGISSKHYESV